MKKNHGTPTASSTALAFLVPIKLHALLSHRMICGGADMLEEGGTFDVVTTRPQSGYEVEQRPPTEDEVL